VVSLADLPMVDLAVICELEDEQNRCGHFTRIFPTTETRYYHQFFENPNKWVYGGGCVWMCGRREEGGGGLAGFVLTSCATRTEERGCPLWLGVPL
jgi:hypothetical protein